MSKDFTKFNVQGIGTNLNKRKLVLEIVKDWINKNNPDFYEVQTVFSDKVQGGNIKTQGFIRKQMEVVDPNRFNMKDPIQLSDGNLIVISNQWGNNISGFIELAKSLGYHIINAGNTTIEDTDSTNKVEINVVFSLLSEETYGETYGEISIIANISVEAFDSYCNSLTFETLAQVIHSVFELNTTEINEAIRSQTNFIAIIGVEEFDWFSLSPHLRIVELNEQDIRFIYNVDENASEIASFFNVDENEVFDLVTDFKTDIHYALDQSNF